RHRSIITLILPANSVTLYVELHMVKCSENNKGYPGSACRRGKAAQPVSRHGGPDPGQARMSRNPGHQINRAGSM
ncbi:MAG TPA: hypothetical protein PLO28_13735, partial [bacterium]|nr:hypothetical protein [bacterium]